jgi:hypothetical protein
MNQNPNNLSASSGAAERFFRLYAKHCIEPDQDSLFNLLNSIHSLNDKLKEDHSEDFFSIPEFVALKAIRNLFHHQGELLNEVRAIPVDDLPPLSTDLIYLCLLPRTAIETAVSGISEKRRKTDEQIIQGTLKWYNDVVNINPCIFNFAVYVYEKINSLNIQLSSSSYLDFQASYELEEQNGYPHFITGDISCNVGSINEVLRIAFADIV